jgi:hypothetical protein
VLSRDVILDASFGTSLQLKTFLGSVTFDNNEFGRTIYISFQAVVLPYDTIFDRHMGRSVRILKLDWYW